MDLPKKAVLGSLRISLGWDSTEEEMSRFMEVLPREVERVRAMSPRVQATTGG
jgi:cysteine sulfinate desulfinase/cysteine desulfurase-like protein